MAQADKFGHVRSRSLRHKQSIDRNETDDVRGKFHNDGRILLTTVYKNRVFCSHVHIIALRGPTVGARRVRKDAFGILSMMAAVARLCMNAAAACLR